MDNYQKLLDKAARLCSNQEKCEYDIYQKLIKWGLSEQNSAKAIEFLVENKFLDNERYTKYYIKDKLRFNKWGRNKIVYSLKQKRISQNIIDDAIENLDPALYDSILDEVLKNKIKSVGNANEYSNKVKLIRFASQRGFLMDEIYASLKRIDIGMQEN